MPDAAAILEPLPQRTAAIDRQLRERLAGSLVYLAGFLRSADWDRTTAMGQAASAMGAGQISPWVFGLYATLVQDASKGQLDLARHKFDLILDGLQRPDDKVFVALDDASLAPEHVAAARLLFDTDPMRPFHPVPPSAAEFAACQQDIVAALALLRKAIPDFADEIALLLRVFLLAAPAGDAPMQQFGAASTFFLWGAIIVNARTRLGTIQVIEVLVHEASHQLLFGLAAGAALSTNDPAKRYASPLRRDPRPIEGVFHAAFVATRVQMAMRRLENSGMAGPEHLATITRTADLNGKAAQTAIDLLCRELQPTAVGRQVLDALVAYWQAAPVPQD